MRHIALRCVRPVRSHDVLGGSIVVRARSLFSGSSSSKQYTRRFESSRYDASTRGIIEIGSTPDSYDRHRARPDQTRRLREAGAGQPGHTCAPEAARERAGAGLSRGTFRRETRRGPDALAPPRKRRASLSLQRFLLRFGDVELFSDHGHAEHTSRIFSGGLQGKRGRRSFYGQQSCRSMPRECCVGARTPYSLWNNTVSV